MRNSCFRTFLLAGIVAGMSCISARAAAPVPQVLTNLTGVTVKNNGTQLGWHTVDATGKITMVGVGADIWNTSDDFYYAYTSKTGDFDVVAKLEAFDAPVNNWAKAGIMVREGVSDGVNTYLFAGGAAGNGGAGADRYFGLQTCRQIGPANNQAIVQCRQAIGESVIDPIAGNPPSFGARVGAVSWPNNWLRVTHIGTVYSAYMGTDGVNWTTVYVTDTAGSPWSSPFPASGPIAVGLFNTAHDGTATNSVATFAFFGDNPQQVPVRIVTQPASTTVVQNRRLTLTVETFGAATTYQWYQGSTALTDATNATYTVQYAASGDVGTYKVVVQNTTIYGTETTVTSANAVVAVTGDSTPPTVASVGGLGTLIGIQFDEEVNAAGATVTINPGAMSATGVKQIALDSIGVTVGTALTAGTTYTAVISGVKDLSGNLMAQATKTFTPSTFQFAQTGAPVQAGDVYPTGPQNYVIENAGRQDWDRYDEDSFVYQAKTGDFDIKVRLQHNEGSSWARAGIEMRETLDEGVAQFQGDGTTANPFSRYLEMHINPPVPVGYDAFLPGFTNRTDTTVNSNYEFNSRQVTGDVSLGWGNQANGFTKAVFPNGWLRMNRQDNVITAFGSLDGVTWVNKGSYTWANCPATMFAGLHYAVEYQNIEATPFTEVQSVLWQAVLRDYNESYVTACSIVTDPVNVAEASENTSVTFTATAAGDPVRYQWFRNDVAIAGATSSTLEYFITVADQGVPFKVRAFNFGNGAPSFGTEAFSKTATIVTVIPDTIPPFVVSALSPSATGSTFDVLFSEPVPTATSTVKANYTIKDSTGKVYTVSGATLSADQLTVTLTFSGSFGNDAYTVTVANVKDRKGLPIVTATSDISYKGVCVVEYYLNIGSGNLASLKTSEPYTNKAPSVVYTTNAIETFVSTGDATVWNGINYGTRLFGWLIAPESGDYAFYMASDDGGQFFMSTDDNPANLNTAAICDNFDGWAGSRAFGNGNAKYIRKPTLVAGKSYYWVGYNKQGGGGGNYAVGWTLPSGITTAIPSLPIGGNDLISYFRASQSTINITEQPPLTLTVTETRDVPLTVKAGGSSDRGGLVTYQWIKNGADITDATNGTYIIVQIPMDASGDVYKCRVMVPGKQVTTAGTTITVTSDTVAPVIAFAEGGSTFDLIYVTFSERITAISGVGTEFTIAGLQITYASFVYDPLTGVPDQTKVIIGTSKQTPGKAYAVVVKGVSDLKGNVLTSNTYNMHAYVLATGVVQWQRYDSLDGAFATIRDYKGPWTGVAGLDSALVGNVPVETPGQEWGDNYNSKFTGLLIAPEDGDYKFYGASDDGHAIYISTDADPANIGTTPIETMGNWANWRIYSRDAVSATNVPNPTVVTLVKGQMYYWTAVYHEGGGGDYLSVAWQRPSDAGPPADGSEPNLRATDFASYVNPDLSSITITAQPTNQSVKEFSGVTFTVVATGASQYGSAMDLQWQRNGVDIPGAKSASYTIPQTTIGDDQAKFSVVMIVPALTNKSDIATLTIVPDLLAPVVSKVFGIDGVVWVKFDKRLDSVTANNMGNYTIKNGSITSATLSTDETMVTLKGTVPAGTAVTVTTVLVKSKGGVAMTSQEVTGVYNSTLLSQDIYDPTVTSGDGFMAGFGIVEPLNATDFNVTGGGSDIWGTKDAFRSVYQAWTGDFDVSVRIESLDLTSKWAKAGIMFRESLEPGSRNVCVLANPTGADNGNGQGGSGNDMYVTQFRSTTGGGSGDWENNAQDGTVGPSGNGGMTWPNVWMRLIRSNDVYFAYRGTNGTDWTLLLTSTGMSGATFGLNKTGYLGLCVSSHNNTKPFDVTTATFRSYKVGQLVPSQYVTPTTLVIVPSGANLLVKWPAANGAWILQGATVLPNWSDLSGQTVVGTENVFTVQPTGNKFFRLIGR